jgi:hypothetical protein
VSEASWLIRYGELTLRTALKVLNSGGGFSGTWEVCVDQGPLSW